MPTLYTQWVEADHWADVLIRYLGKDHRYTIRAVEHRDALRARLDADEAAA